MSPLIISRNENSNLLKNVIFRKYNIKFKRHLRAVSTDLQFRRNDSRFVQ